MKRLNFPKITRICLISFVLLSALPLRSQPAEAQIYSNPSVTESKAYLKGNIFQKDLLLFIDMLENCHPAFAPGQKQPLKLNRVRRTAYKWAAECSSSTELHHYLQDIIGRLHDGHSTLAPNVDFSRIYPFAIQINEGSVILSAIDKKYEQYLGKDIISINGEDVTKVLESFKPQISSDNINHFLSNVGGRMQFASEWEMNPYRSDDDSLTLVMDDNTRICLGAVPQKELNIAWMPQQDNLNGPFQRTRQPFSYQVYPEMDICYMEFNTCTDQSTLRQQISQTGNQYGISDEELEKRLIAIPRFDDFAKKLFTELRDKEIGTLIIDVRDNAGGNSTLGDILLSWLAYPQDIKRYHSFMRISPLWQSNYPLLAKEYESAFARSGKKMILGKMYDTMQLPQPASADTLASDEYSEYFRFNSDSAAVFKGQVFILIGNRTYSSAGMFVTVAYDNHIAEVVGNASTFSPTHYGDVLSWKLPNTGISGYLSHKLFVRPDASRSDEDTISPEISIEEFFKQLSARFVFSNTGLLPENIH